MTRRNPRSGIALLEMLIALAIMAMTAALLAAMFGRTVGIMDRGEVQASAIEQAVGRQQLRAWLDNALLSPDSTDGRPMFSGTADALTFLTVVDDGVFWPGRAVQVSLPTGPPVAVADGFAGDAGETVSQSIDLAPSGTGLEFSYWGSAEPNEEPTWQASWPMELGVPALVRITFVSAVNPLPPLVARPGKARYQSEMSLSSLLPPARPSLP